MLTGAFLCAIFVISCSTVPLTGRSQLSLVDDAQLQEAALGEYKTFLNDPKTKVIRNSAEATRVKNVGSRIAAAITRYMSQNGYGNAYNYNYEFNLIESKDVNAWCMPGGKVAVFTGILPVTQTDAGLATVMGHEIAHAIAKHSAERYSQMVGAQAVGGALGAATSGSSQATQQIVGQLYGVGGQLALLKYGRKQETEADRLGLVFMAMAGYNPESSISFWQRMAAKSNGAAPPEFLSTHPSDATRISNIQKSLPEAMKYYKK